MTAPAPRRLRRQQQPPEVRLKPRTVRLRIPEPVRAAVEAREGQRCPMCGERMTNANTHHRKLRSQGGTDDVVNLVRLHHGCHNSAHLNPQWAKENGWIVPAEADPASTPIVMYDGRRVLLTADGGYLEVAA